MLLVVCLPSKMQKLWRLLCFRCVVLALTGGRSLGGGAMSDDRKNHWEHPRVVTNNAVDRE